MYKAGTRWAGQRKAEEKAEHNREVRIIPDFSFRGMGPQCFNASTL